MPMINSKEEYLAQLKLRLSRESFKGAICDMAGWAYQDMDGKTKTISFDAPHSQRYEIRSRAHVQVYGFKVLHTNY